MAAKIRVGVLTGGASSEREISLASGRMIAEHLPRDRYEVVVFDTLALLAANPTLSPSMRSRARALLAGRQSPEALEERDRELPPLFLDQIRDAAAEAAPATEALALTSGHARVDVVFLALHGRYGEDGTIQGMLELLGIPFVGSGTLASALAMDKPMAKKVFAAEGIPSPRGLVVERAAFRAEAAVAVQRAAALLPAAVKPVCQGSSIGMTMVSDPLLLPAALEEAFAYDSRALVEERIRGRELTVGVIGNRDPAPLPVVEILPRGDFFDYRAKYDPESCEEICPARIAPERAAEVQRLAVRAHQALGCRGLSRVDMMDSGSALYVLEVNTLPGMTINSLLPKAAAAAGLPFGELLHRLVQWALEND